MSEIDNIIAVFDTLFDAGEFAAANYLFTPMHAPYITMQERLCVLSATLCAKSRLPRREWYYTQTREILTASDPGRCDRLLDGLR